MRSTGLSPLGSPRGPVPSLVSSGAAFPLGKLPATNHPRPTVLGWSFFLACSPRIGACSRGDLADVMAAPRPIPAVLCLSVLCFSLRSVEDSPDCGFLDQGLGGAGSRQPLHRVGDSSALGGGPAQRMLPETPDFRFVSAWANAPADDPRPADIGRAGSGLARGCRSSLPGRGRCRGHGQPECRATGWVRA